MTRVLCLSLYLEINYATLHLISIFWKEDNLALDSHLLFELMHAR